MSDDEPTPFNDGLCPECSHLQTLHPEIDDSDNEKTCIVSECNCKYRFNLNDEKIQLENDEILQVDHDIKFNEDGITSHETEITRVKKDPSKEIVDEPSHNIGGGKTGSNKKNNRTTAIIFLLIISAIIVVFVWASFLTNTFMFETQRAEQWSQAKCEGILMEGKAIMLRNGNPEDYSLMNQDDRWNIGILEDDFLLHCTVFKDDVMKYDYDLCLENLLSWHGYVDMLPDKNKETWTDEMILDTNAYESIYNEKRCDLIETEMRSSDEWMQHNEIHHSDNEDI